MRIAKPLVGCLKMDIWMLNHDKNRNDPTLRRCDVCKNKKQREFGKYVPLDDGLRQKWYCAKCYELRNMR